LLAATALLAPGSQRARASDIEGRDFTITVDGKQAGDYHMTIRGQDDGTVTLSAQSDVRVTILAVPVYTYSYRGQEVWKNGRLLQFHSSGDEKGKAFDVSAVADGAGLRVTANGQEHRTRPDVWTTSCWQLPPAQYRNADVALLGCDTGADVNGRLSTSGRSGSASRGRCRPAPTTGSPAARCTTSGTTAGRGWCATSG